MTTTLSCPTHGIKIGASITTPADRFCEECGTGLTEAQSHGCGREIFPLDKFCPRCGEALSR